MNLKNENQQTPSHHRFAHFSSISFHQYHSSILLLEAIILSISWCQSKGVSSTQLNIWIWSHCCTRYIEIYLVNWCCEYMPIAISKSLRPPSFCCLLHLHNISQRFTYLFKYMLYMHPVIILALLTGCNFPWRTERDELQKSGKPWRPLWA